MDKEVWRQIPEFPDYDVSNIGRIKRGDRILKTQKNFGYIYIGLTKNRKVYQRRVHCLVLSAFICKRPNKYHGAHLNNKKADNRLENLKWVTQRENEAHKKIHGVAPIGSQNGYAKLTESDIVEIRCRYTRTSYRVSNVERLAKEFGVCGALIRAIVRGERWKHVPLAAYRKATE